MNYDQYQGYTRLQLLECISSLKADAIRARARATAPFERQDLEGMTQPQLLSLVVEGINACRRKGMLEAEGLAQKHTNLSRETDIQLLQGMAKSYGDRADELLRQRDEEAKRSAQPDTRPLTEKLAPTTRTTLNRAWVQPFDEGFTRLDRRALALTKPKANTLTEGADVVVNSQTIWGLRYTLSKLGEVTQCTCPSWSHQSSPTTHRTCKHLRKWLGDDAENARITRPQPSCYCGVLLIRGQCQRHAAVWKGDERCECGRLFWFCKDESARHRQLRGVDHKPRIKA